MVWTWEDPLVSMDTVAMSTYYGVPANRTCFWQRNTGTPKVKVIYLRMLALLPDCVVFCTTVRHTLAELFAYVMQVLESADVDPVYYTLALDWCCVAS